MNAKCTKEGNTYISPKCGGESNNVDEEAELEFIEEQEESVFERPYETVCTIECINRFCKTGTVVGAKDGNKPPL